MKNRYLEGIGILTGMIFGAGIFALPYVISQSGLWLGGLFFAIALVFIIILHFRFGEVAAHTNGVHRFTGYVRLWLGKKPEVAALFTTLFGYFGTLLIYGLMGGTFLFNLFPFISQFWWSIIFWIAAAFVLLLNLKEIGVINFYLTIPLFVFVILLAAMAAPYFKAANLNITSAGFRFLPYGVILFSLSGFAAVPEVHDIFQGRSLKTLGNNSVKKLKTVIVISILVSALFYAIFVLSTLAISGPATSKEAIAGISAILGKKAVIAGSIIGFLAVFTSFVSLGLDLRGIFKYDYKISGFNSWLLTISIPIMLFLLGATNFIKAISLVGAVGLGLTGIFIIFMFRKLRHGNKKLNHKNAGGGKKVSSAIDVILAVSLIAGVAYEIIGLF